MEHQLLLAAALCAIHIFRGRLYQHSCQRALRQSHSSREVPHIERRDAVAVLKDHDTAVHQPRTRCLARQLQLEVDARAEGFHIYFSDPHRRLPGFLSTLVQERRRNSLCHPLHQRYVSRRKSRNPSLVVATSLARQRFQMFAQERPIRGG